jgi:iron complex outermembrane receptor protein
VQLSEKISPLGLNTFVLFSRGCLPYSVLVAIIRPLNEGVGMISKWGAAALVALGMVARLTFAQTTPAPPDSPSASQRTGQDTGQLEEIVVTALRRQTNLVDTPVAVSSFGGEQLQQRQINSLADLNGLVPGMEFGQSETDARITIRGVGTNNVSGGADPGVAFHLDGVYIGSTSIAAGSFFDIARVEVLRGPQGTLFGQNATGGAVNVIPNRPTADFSGTAGVTLGADPFQYIVDGVLNGPLTSDRTLTGRISFQRSYNTGYGENLNGSVEPLGPRRLDDDDSYAFRGQLRWDPNDTFAGHVSLNYRHHNDAGQAIQLLGAAPDGAITPAEQLGGVRPDPDSHDVYANYGVSKSDDLLVSFDTSTKVAAGTLKTLVSALQTHSTIGQDADGTVINYVTETFQLHANEYFGEILYDVNPVERMDLIVGVNAFSQHLNETNVVPVAFPLGVGPFGGAATADTAGTLPTSTYAGFLHSTFNITPSLQFFGGVRYTYDRKGIDQSVTVSDVVALGGITIPAGAETQAHHWDRTTYEGGVSQKLSDEVTAYAKYSTGFKGGGYQIGTLGSHVNPETDGSAELGLKGLFFASTLEANLSVFRMTYDDLQVPQVIGLFLNYVNAAKAHINGAELDGVWRATKAWRFEFSGSFLDAKFDEFNTEDSADPARGVQNLAGNTLPSAPRFTMSIGTYYAIPMAAIGTVTLGGRYYWQDTEYFSEFNLPLVSQRAAGRADISADLLTTDEKWRVSLFARNLTDKVVRSDVLVVSPTIGSPALATLEPGRFVGVSVRRSF